MYLCGTTSFSHVDVDDDGSCRGSSRRRPKPSKLKLKLKKKKKSISALGRSAKRSSNPYAASGLDKFEKLLAELEAEKKKILLKKGSGEDTVRFRYGSAEERIPIVIKRPQSPPAKKKKKNAEVEKLQVAQEEAAAVVTNISTRKVVMNKRSSCWCWNWSRVPCWAVVVALVVLLCMMFGRAFAVSWAAILWYMVPMMKCDRRRNLMKREEEYGKRLGRIFFRVTGGYSTSIIKVEKMGDGTSQDQLASPS